MKKLNIILIMFIIIGIIAWSVLYAANYSIDQMTESIDTNNIDLAVNNAEKKEVIKALICGTNQTLTDTILYVAYDVQSGKLSYLSIPRDTYVVNSYAYANKINSIYRGENVLPLINQVEDMLDVSIDYYLFFDNDIVKELVDLIGGVEIDVPIRMKYDDVTQDLHINLYPGVQILDGDKAEQFIRFRKNNDGSGYRMGDIERTATQQYFIKELIKTVVQPANLLKASDIINILLGNTDTNITPREALRYVEDIPNLKLDEIYSETAIGTTPYINNLSYFKMNEEETKAILSENFSD